MGRGKPRKGGFSKDAQKRLRAIRDARRGPAAGAAAAPRAPPRVPRSLEPGRLSPGARRFFASDGAALVLECLRYDDLARVARVSRRWRAEAGRLAPLQETIFRWDHKQQFLLSTAIRALDDNYRNNIMQSLKEVPSSLKDPVTVRLEPTFGNGEGAYVVDGHGTSSAESLASYLEFLDTKKCKGPAVICAAADDVPKWHEAFRGSRNLQGRDLLKGHLKEMPTMRSSRLEVFVCTHDDLIDAWDGLCDLWARAPGNKNHTQILVLDVGNFEPRPFFSFFEANARQMYDMYRYRIVFSRPAPPCGLDLYTASVLLDYFHGGSYIHDQYDMNVFLHLRVNSLLGPLRVDGSNMLEPSNLTVGYAAELMRRDLNDILQTSPLTITVDTSHARTRRKLTARRCDVCRRQGPLAEERFPLCDGCGARRYCGQDCQRADWIEGRHRDACPFVPPVATAAETPPIQATSEEAETAIQAASEGLGTSGPRASRTPVLDRMRKMLGVTGRRRANPDVS